MVDSQRCAGCGILVGKLIDKERRTSCSSSDNNVETKKGSITMVTKEMLERYLELEEIIDAAEDPRDVSAEMAEVAEFQLDHTKTVVEMYLNALGY